MRQAPRKRSGPVADFMGYHSTIVRILQGGCGRGSPWTDGLVLACALDQRRVWLGVRRCPTCPPSNVFRNRGTRCTPGGGGGAAPPAPRLGNGRALPHLPLSTGGGTRCACWTGGLVVACALLQRGVGLACAVVPPAHPPTFLETGGTRCTPGGAAPPAPRLGNGGALPHLPLSTGGRTRCACWTGGLVVACALLQRGVGLACAVVPPAPPSNVFRNRGDTPCTPCGGCAPCTLLGVRRWRAWVGAS